MKQKKKFTAPLVLQTVEVLLEGDLMVVGASNISDVVGTGHERENYEMSSSNGYTVDSWLD